MQIGYYYDIGETKTPFIGRWQWRINNVGGGDHTKEEAIENLKLCGATECVDVTSEGGSEEFGMDEINGEMQ